jgi:hypothetical protein
MPLRTRPVVFPFVTLASAMKEGDALLNDASRRYERAALQIQNLTASGSMGQDFTPKEMNDAMRAIANAKVLRETVISAVTGYVARVEPVSRSCTGSLPHGVWLSGCLFHKTCAF